MPGPPHDARQQHRQRQWQPRRKNAWIQAAFLLVLVAGALNSLFLLRGYYRPRPSAAPAPSTGPAEAAAAPPRPQGRGNASGAIAEGSGLHREGSMRAAYTRGLNESDGGSGVVSSKEATTAGTARTAGEEIDSESGASRLPRRAIRAAAPAEAARNVTIFYNIYVPPGREGRDRALAIVEEQLAARRASPAVAGARLYYTLIGGANATSVPNCQPCEPLGAPRAEGTEQLTLQALHGHCASRRSDVVVYVHNKGSRTPTAENDNLRRALTKAAFSGQCARMPPGAGGCTACAAAFGALPQPSTAGNMFAAECSYVNKLLPPAEYARSKERLMREAWARKNDTIFLMSSHLSYQFERPSWAGTGRFAMEQWVHGHPSARPCAVYPEGFGYLTAPADGGWVPRRRPVPRVRRGTPPIRMPVHPWFKLRGRLVEWRYHYKSEPPEGSWVWWYYSRFLPETPEELQADMPAIASGQ